MLMLAQTVPSTQAILVNSHAISVEQLALWGAIGTAIVIGLFKLVDLIIERMGNTKRLWQQQMETKAAVQNLATATKDVATTQAGGAMPNLDPNASSLKAIDNISRGGTGNGGLNSTGD